ncbi:MAG: NUDIX domain-containing protein [Cycloclasticus sp.]|nr:NUDIX domain-containing protein [Cycloclasticus sp.]
MVREAAAMVIVRDTNNGIEVCMLRRVEQSRFAAGAYVFPGGAVDQQDSQVNPSYLCPNKSADQPSLMRYKIAALRETFEEAGLLAATVRSDTMTNGTLREKLQQNSVSFERVLQQLNITIKLDEIVFYDHWVTPEGAPIRFDTRFFLSTVDNQQELLHDNKETDQSCWIKAEEVLALYDQGEVKLMPVTHVQLKRLSNFKSISQLIDYAKKEINIKPTLPVLNYDDSGKPTSVTIDLVEGQVEYPTFRKA